MFLFLLQYNSFFFFLIYIYIYIELQYIENKQQSAESENEKNNNIVKLSIPQVDDKSIKVLLFDVVENQREEHLISDNIQQDEEWETLDKIISEENHNHNFNNSFINNQNTCTIGGN